jgi:hypothetical protein
MESDRVFNSVTIEKSLCLPQTSEINPKGKISEIKYNIKTKTLMLKTSKGWKHFGTSTDSVKVPENIQPSQNFTYNLNPTAPPLYDNITISKPENIIDVDYVQSGLYNEIINNPNSHLKYRISENTKLFNFLDLLSVKYIIKDDYPSFGYLQIVSF